MDAPKLIIIVSFFAIVISVCIKNFRKKTFKHKNISEYVFISLAVLFGVMISYPYYEDFIPITLWSVIPGVSVALIVEALKKRNYKG